MKTLLILIALALTGCATGQADYYAAEQARHATEKARWEAMARIAESGDVTAKAVALAVMGGSGGRTQATAAPVNEALAWAQVLVPGLTQAYAINANMQTAINASNNGAAVAQSTNSTFVGIAGQIKTAAPNVSTVTTTSTDSHNTATTLSGTGTLGSGAYSTTDHHDSTVTPAPVITPVVQIVPVAGVAPVVP